MFENRRPLRHAVVAVIEDGDEVLFMERAAMDTYPGYWSAVTGQMDGDETQHKAIIRECREEVGLNVKPVRKVWESATRNAPFVLHWWQCRLDGPREVTPDETEVAAWKWMKLKDVPKLALMFSDSRYFFREIYPVTRHR